VRVGVHCGCVERGTVVSKGNLKMLTCAERDAYLHIGTLQSHEGWGVESSLTDLDVRFGDARIETTWVKKR